MAPSRPWSRRPSRCARRRRTPTATWCCSRTATTRRASTSRARRFRSPAGTTWSTVAPAPSSRRATRGRSRSCASTWPRASSRARRIRPSTRHAHRPARGPQGGAAAGLRPSHVEAVSSDCRMSRPVQASWSSGRSRPVPSRSGWRTRTTSRHRCEIWWRSATASATVRPAPRVTAGRCHLDHDTPYPHGPTAAWNLRARAERTHQRKHYGWTPLPTPTSTLWFSPAGQAVEVLHHSTPAPGVDADAVLPEADDLAALDAHQLTAPDEGLRPPWLPAGEKSAPLTCRWLADDPDLAV